MALGLCWSPATLSAIPCWPAATGYVQQSCCGNWLATPPQLWQQWLWRPAWPRLLGFSPSYKAVQQRFTCWLRLLLQWCWLPHRELICTLVILIRHMMPPSPQLWSPWGRSPHCTTPLLITGTMAEDTVSQVAIQVTLLRIMTQTQLLLLSPQHSGTQVVQGMEA